MTILLFLASLFDVCNKKEIRVKKNYIVVLLLKLFENILQHLTYLILKNKIG